MPHKWTFARVGGFDQVVLSSGADLVALAELDQKLWVALASPISGLEHDERTLALMDTDHDGRIRANELVAAARWVGTVLKDPEVLATGASELSLQAIDDRGGEGRLLAQTARRVLSSIGKPTASAISVDDMKDAVKAFERQPLNGDGIIVPGSTSDPDLAQAIAEALDCTASPPIDRSGAPGLDEAAVRAFFAAVRERATWLMRQRTETSLRPLGDATPPALSAYLAIRAKVDDWFARQRVAAYDPRALAAVNGEEKAYLDVAAKDLDLTVSELERLPIVQVVAGVPLPLAGPVNPAWSARLDALRDRVLGPLLGEVEVLTEMDWLRVRASLEPVATHAALRPGASVERLAPDRIEALAAGGDVEARMLALVAEEAKLGPEAQAIESVERLVRYVRDLMEIANNFVSFRDFYSRRKPAAFQVGTLYIDQRACELCIDVRDAGRHATMAPLANTYLIYCDLKNAKGQTRQICAALTAGDVDNLMVGRNGIFYDRDGVDWDATVTRLVDNPIGLGQAFWSPYKKVLRMAEEYVASRVVAAQAAVDTKLTTTATELKTAIEADATKGPTPPPAVAKPIDIGTVAALGVAVGGITAAFGAILQAFFGLGIWMPFGFVGVVLLISGPSMAVAWLKLRKRNLGPLLDANGWAVNAMAKVNVPLGASLTREAKLPKGSARVLQDPFAEKKRPWGIYATLLLALALGLGWLTESADPYLPEPVRAARVLRDVREAASGLKPTPGALPAPAEAPAAPPAAN